jgi:hypothetical protein
MLSGVEIVWPRTLGFGMAVIPKGPLVMFHSEPNGALVLDQLYRLLKMSACTARLTRTKKSPRNRHDGSDTAKLSTAEITAPVAAAGKNPHPWTTESSAYTYAPIA